MTEEEYLRMKNILSTVVEQQVALSESQTKAEARLGEIETKMSRNAEAIAALLTIAQLHEQEITRTNEQMNIRFEQVNKQLEQLANRSAETGERINVLVDVVERYISKN